MSNDQNRYDGPEIDNLRPNGPYTDVTLHLDPRGFLFYRTADYDTVTSQAEWDGMKWRRRRASGDYLTRKRGRDDENALPE